MNYTSCYFKPKDIKSILYKILSIKRLKHSLGKILNIYRSDYFVGLSVSICKSCNLCSVTSFCIMYSNTFFCAFMGLE